MNIVKENEPNIIIIPVRIMGMDESFHQRVFDDHMAIIETPLVDSSKSYYPGSHNNKYTYPFNMSGQSHAGSDELTNNNNNFQSMCQMCV